MVIVLKVTLNDQLEWLEVWTQVWSSQTDSWFKLDKHVSLQWHRDHLSSLDLVTLLHLHFSADGAGSPVPIPSSSAQSTLQP